MRILAHSNFSLGFPSGRDSATFQDSGTEVPSLSRDKGTTGQSKNLAKGRDGTDVLKQENDVRKQEIRAFF